MTSGVRWAILLGMQPSEFFEALWEDLVRIAPQTAAIAARLEPRGDGFAAELVWRGVGQRALELDVPEGDTLALRVDQKPHRLKRLGRRDPWPPQRLTPGAICRDDAIELASRRSAADWQHWMDTLIDSHFSSGDIPAN